MMAARKMAEMAEHLPERTGDPTDYALRRQLRVAGVGQGDRCRQYRSEKDGSPAHALATFPTKLGGARALGKTARNTFCRPKRALPDLPQSASVCVNQRHKQKFPAESIG